MGSFRLKVRGKWTKQIPAQATAMDVEVALEDIEGIENASVNLTRDVDAWGGAEYFITFEHYSGSSPNGRVLQTAGNIPPIEVDTSTLYGANIKTSVTTIQNGTDPVTDDESSRGFRIVTPGDPSNYEYPLTNVT
eukprot:13378686-Ditylum_brightwellii.AAC.1